MNNATFIIISKMLQYLLTKVLKLPKAFMQIISCYILFYSLIMSYLFWKTSETFLKSFRNFWKISNIPFCIMTISSKKPRKNPLKYYKHLSFTKKHFSSCLSRWNIFYQLCLNIKASKSFYTQKKPFKAVQGEKKPSKLISEVWKSF